LVVRTPRTNALFGQVIKSILAVMHPDDGQGKDGAHDGCWGPFWGLLGGGAWRLGWHEGSYRPGLGVFSPACTRPPPTWQRLRNARKTGSGAHRDGSRSRHAI